MNIDNIMFIHIPKTAGRSIYHKLLVADDAKHQKNTEAWMGWDDEHKLWKQHLTMSQRIGLYNINMQDFFSFAFVRNPWDRAVSDFLWMLRRGKSKKLTFDCYLNRKGQYMRSILRRTKEYRGDHLTPQYDFIYMDDVQKVDYVGRFENINEDWNNICEMLGIDDQRLPHIGNAHREKSYREWYNNERKKLVESIYEKDIETFNYSF